MKKFIYLSLSLFVFLGSFLSISLAGQEEKKEPGNSIANPVDVLNSVKHNANKDNSETVQNTKLDNTISNCGELAVDSRFTITKTLCNIKGNIQSYLQYVMFAGLTLATILIIRNGFQLVTSSDRAKQIGVFKKNMIYIVVGVILMLSFYWILDAFVALVNLIAE